MAVEDIIGIVIQTVKDLKAKIRKKSSTDFDLIFPTEVGDELRGECTLSADLTKSINLQAVSCKDVDGTAIEKMKVVSKRAIDPEEYRSTLKSIKLELDVYSLRCPSELKEKEEGCFNSIQTDQEQDWSYILNLP